MGFQQVDYEQFPAVTLYHYGEWTAVYHDDRLIHWHDTPSLEDFCDLLGIECTSHMLHQAFIRKAGESVPQSLKELKEQLLWYSDREKMEKIAALQAEIEEIKSSLTR